MKPDRPINGVRPSLPAPPEVDVIVLSWNRVDDTLAAIDSACGQRRVRLRVLVLDQGSEPGNLRRLRQGLHRRQQVRLREMGRNLGVAGGRNAATAMGQAPVVVALDSDAVFAHPLVLAEVAARMAADPGLGAIAFRITNFFSRENDHTSWDYPAGCRPERAFGCSRFIGAGHALRREAFERAGGYDEKLFFCGEELDLCYRLLNLGFRIEYRPEAEVLHKVSPEHRVHWGRGRYFYTVRNNLYSSYKFGVPLPRLAVAAAAFTARGLANGVAREALRGIREAVRMGQQFRRAAPENAQYHLSPATWQRIGTLEPWRQEGIAGKLRRQFHRLPGQA